MRLFGLGFGLKGDPQGAEEKASKGRFEALLKRESPESTKREIDEGSRDEEVLVPAAMNPEERLQVARLSGAQAMIRQIWDSAVPLRGRGKTERGAPGAEIAESSPKLKRGGDREHPRETRNETPRRLARDAFFDRGGAAGTESDRSPKENEKTKRAESTVREPSKKGRRQGDDGSQRKNDERSGAPIARIVARKIEARRFEVREVSPAKPMVDLPPVPAPAVPTSVTLADPVAPVAQPSVTASPHSTSPDRVAPERVPERLRSAIESGKQEVRIKLDPPELGGLDVRIAIEGGEVRVVVRAEHADAAALFQQSLGELRHQLAESGLRLADAEVSTGGEERERERRSAHGEPETEPETPSKERSGREISRANDVRAIA